MKTQEAIDYFGGVKQLAVELGVWPHTIYRWGETVPRGKAYELEVKTGGKLKATTDKE